MPRSTKDFKVAIVGGGMSGLALAVGLTRVGLEVEIYEAAVSTDPAVSIKHIELLFIH